MAKDGIEVVSVTNHFKFKAHHASSKVLRIKLIFLYLQKLKDKNRRIHGLRLFKGISLLIWMPLLYLYTLNCRDYKMIPQGNSREDAKTRKRIIGDFYSKWIAKHPDKRIWNYSLRAYIHVKYQSINETKGRASISYESTCAVLQLTKLLKRATVVQRKQSKTNDKNQRSYDQMIILFYKGIRLLVAHQKSSDEYIQYCITAKK